MPRGGIIEATQHSGIVLSRTAGPSISALNANSSTVSTSTTSTRSDPME